MCIHTVKSWPPRSQWQNSSSMSTLQMQPCLLAQVDRLRLGALLPLGCKNNSVTVKARVVPQASHSSSNFGFWAAPVSIFSTSDQVELSRFFLPSLGGTLPAAVWTYSSWLQWNQDFSHGLYGKDCITFIIWIAFPHSLSDLSISAVIELCLVVHGGKRVSECWRGILFILKGHSKWFS